MSPAGEGASAGTRGPVHVVVVGSINMDLIAPVAGLPAAGQTVSGRELLESPGGKGANQAVAAARLGARVSFIGRIGDDGFGVRLGEGLRGEQIDTRAVRTTENCSSGVAIVCVEDAGENTIVVIPGANGCLSPADIAQAEHVIASADVLLVQLETPLETVAAAVETARQHGVLTVLDPAPAPSALPDTLLAVDVICPNESEAAALTGIPIASRGDAEHAARLLRERGARHAVITLGRRGALVCGPSGTEHVPSFPVPAIDATAAGDAFAAALGVAYAETGELRQGIAWGCAAGALAASRLGAQLAMPTREEVIRLLERGELPAGDGVSPRPADQRTDSVTS